MTTNTWLNTGGGSWETASNWSGQVNPGVAGNDALINAPGTYTVTTGAVESPTSVTLNDAAATLAIGASGQLLLSSNPLTISAGTLQLVSGGIINSGTVVNTGGVFEPTGGTLNAVTWQGPLISPAAGSYSLNIEGGLTLLNAAGNAPGTLDIGGLSAVTVDDSTPLNNLQINIDAVRDESLNGPGSGALVLGANAFLNESSAGASGTISGQTLTSQGTISATGSGSSLAIGDTVFNNQGTLIAGGGGTVAVSEGFNNNGTVGISGGGVLRLTTANNAILSNNSTMSVASAGTFQAGAYLAGGGSSVITLASFAVVDLYNTSDTIVFLDGRGIERLEAPETYTGVIAGFQHGDMIDLVATPVSSVIYTPAAANQSSGGVLTAKNGTTVVAALNLEGDYVGFTFGFQSDGGTGTDLTVGCFAAGTRILSMLGEIPVEDLRERDLLPVHSASEPRQIVWIGHRDVDCRQHPNPSVVWPVRVAAHAFGMGLPHRDLFLSPDHAVFVNDVLIQIRLLVNGTSIAQVQVDTVTYYHVELDGHDVVWAEGLAAETYLETGSGANFAGRGAVTALYPDFGVRMWEAAAYAPLVFSGPALEAARRSVTALQHRVATSSRRDNEAVA